MFKMNNYIVESNISCRYFLTNIRGITNDIIVIHNKIRAPDGTISKGFELKYSTQLLALLLCYLFDNLIQNSNILNVEIQYSICALFCVDIPCSIEF